MLTNECETEPLIYLCDVPKLSWLPSRDGRRLSLATIYRWLNRGVRGVRLKAKRVGGTWATSEAWLKEFFDALSGSPAPAAISGSPTTAPVSRTTRQRQTEISEVKQRLDQAGL